MASRLEVVITGDTKQLEQALSRGVKSTSGFQKGLNIASVAGGAALLALGAAAKVGFDEFRQGELVAAQTAAVLKSTGGAANVTATQVDGLATSLMKKSGVDDEVIKSGQNMLLTFTKIRDEAGKGNDIFTQATGAALDLSVAMGKDLNSSALLVGKALNDPIKGMGALSRAGVQFTDSQKSAIKAMVETGNTAGAQKLILKELQTQFGGSAAAAGKTFAGQMKIAKETASNLAGELISGAMPALRGLGSIISGATKFMSEHKGVTQVAISVVAGLSAGVIALNVVMRASAAVTAAAAAVKGIFVTGTTVATAATVGQTGAQTGLNVAMRANPIGIVITALVALGAGLVLAWQRSETFRGIVTGAFNAVKSAASAVAGAVQDVIGWIRDLVGSKAVAVLGAVLSAPFRAAIGSIRAVIGAIQTVISLARAAASAVRNAFQGGDPANTTLIPGVTYGGGIPRGAHGAIVTRPTMALIGEAGPEAVVPLSGTPGSSALPTGRGGTVNNFHFHGAVSGREDVIEWVTQGLIRQGRRVPGALGGLA